MNCTEPDNNCADQNKVNCNGVVLGSGGGNSNDLLNNSYRLQTSIGSSFSSDTDLSFSLATDREVNAQYARHMRNADELPAFEIRLLSPMGRSPSPIDNDITDPPYIMGMDINENIANDKSPLRMPGVEYVALHDINAQISPPNDAECNNNNNKNNTINPVGSLETIYEGVFLSTPPQPIRKSRLATWSNGNINANAMNLNNLNNNNNIIKSSRVSLLEKEAFVCSQQQRGKENRSNFNLQRAIFATATTTTTTPATKYSQEALKDYNNITDT